MKKIIYLIILAVLPTMVLAKSELPPVKYTKADSALVVKLLKEAAKLPKNASRMEFFGNKFMNIPYVAYTLEVTPTEQLIVNLHELDCTTFVETCTALTIADKRKEHTFEGFCKALCDLRFKDGKCDGYVSRLHYFTQWTNNNEKMGFIKDVSHKGSPFTAKQVVDIHYMSKFPEKYKHLKDDPERVPTIKKLEDEVNGQTLLYIPNKLLNKDQNVLKDVKTGDIIGLVTTKDGLDASHLGIAIWKNGKLHLLNASSIAKKVTLNNLYKYMTDPKRKTNIGIRVIRVL